MPKVACLAEEWLNYTSRVPKTYTPAATKISRSQKPASNCGVSYVPDYATPRRMPVQKIDPVRPSGLPQGGLEVRFGGKVCNEVILVIIINSYVRSKIIVEARFKIIAEARWRWPREPKLGTEQQAWLPCLKQGNSIFNKGTRNRQTYLIFSFFEKRNSATE